MFKAKEALCAKDQSLRAYVRLKLLEEGHWLKDRNGSRSREDMMEMMLRESDPAEF